jgi:hypothetical protein
MFSALRKTDPDWFIFDWRVRSIREWESGALVVADVIRRPIAAMGLLAKCTTAGQSHAREPSWRAVQAATVQDGSVVWTMVPPTGTNIPTISSCVYSITPSGIVQVTDAIDGAQLRTRVRLDAVAAAEGDYTIVATMTDSLGEQYVWSETFPVIA